MKNICLAWILGVLGSCLLSCGTPDEPEVSAVQQTSTYSGNGDRTLYSWGTRPPAPLDAVGRLNTPGGSCSGTLIAPNKVLTAYHCVLENPASGFSFTPHGAASSVGVARILHGRECCGAPGDFALLTLSSSVTGRSRMARGWPPTVPLVLNDAGYSSDLASNTLGVHFGCQLRSWKSDSTGWFLRSDCDYQSGASGGPAYIYGASGPVIYGVNSGGSGLVDVPYNDGNANLVSSGHHFAFAPDYAFGIASAASSTGRQQIYATDRDWSLVAARGKIDDNPSGNWYSWSALDAQFYWPRAVAATNLPDLRQSVFVITDTGVLRQKWQVSLDGGWSSWITLGTPVAIKDIAATGGTTPHLFALGTNNVVYVSYKISGPEWAFSGFCPLGTINDAQSISAVFDGSTRSVFIASSSTGAWMSSAAWTGCTAWSSFSSFGGAPFRAIASGRLQDGRVHVWAVTTAGVLQHRIGSIFNGGFSAWSDFGLPNPANTFGFSKIHSARLQDGRETIYGIANGEIVHTWELAPGSFNYAWTRFYTNGY